MVEEQIMSEVSLYGVRSFFTAVTAPQHSLK